MATTKLPAMSSARALCGIARSRERRRRVTLQPFRETQRLVLTRSRTPPLTSRRANSGAGRGGNSPADSGCYGRQRSKRRAPLHAARASDKSPPPGKMRDHHQSIAHAPTVTRTRPLSVRRARKRPPGRPAGWGRCRVSAKGRRDTPWRVGCGRLTGAGQWSSRDHMEDVPVLHRLERGRPIFFNLVEPLDIEATQQPLDLPTRVERHLSMC